MSYIVSSSRGIGERRSVKCASVDQCNDVVQAWLVDKACRTINVEVDVGGDGDEDGGAWDEIFFVVRRAGKWKAQVLDQRWIVGGGVWPED